MTATEAPVRPRHLLSLVVCGAAAGLWSWFAIVFSLMLVLWPTGVLPAGFSSLRVSVAGSIGALLAGLYYVHLLGWLPRGLLARSAMFIVLGTPVIAGFQASAYSLPTTAASERDLSWVVVEALGASVATPVMLRFVVIALVRWTDSAAGLPLTRSLWLIALLSVGLLGNLTVIGDLLAQVPLGTTTVVTLLIALATAVWTIGVRPEHQRPRWYRPFGWAVAGLVSLTGAAMLVGAVAT